MRLSTTVLASPAPHLPVQCDKIRIRRSTECPPDLQYVVYPIHNLPILCAGESKPSTYFIQLEMTEGPDAIEAHAYLPPKLEGVHDTLGKLRNTVLTDEELDSRTKQQLAAYGE